LTYYIDTNIWVYAIIAHPKYGEKCKQILKKIEAKKLEAAISTQVLGEVAGVLYNKYKVKDTTSQLNAILSYPIDIYIVYPDTIRVAAEYARDYGITPYDGIHIALAVENNITDMISADKELDKVELIRRTGPTEFKHQ
jgi:predicted nucleic acid-binding protein